MEEQDKKHIQDNVGNASRHHKQEWADRVPHRAEHIGFHVQDQDKRHSEEIDPQIENRAGHRLCRRLQQGKHGRCRCQPDPHQHQAEDCKHRNRISGCTLHIPGTPRAVDLRNDDGCPRRDRNKETDQKIDNLGGTSAHCRQRNRTDKLADDHSVNGVVELLDTGACGNRKEKHKQTFPDNTCRKVFF